MTSPDRATLRALLLRWASAELTEREVHEQAEHLWESRRWPEYPETDDRSIAIEVLCQLDILNHQLVTTEDIPALLEFLATPPGQAAEGWRRWRQYWERLDFEHRRRSLAANSYYVT